MIPLAHVGGFPLEETLLELSPAASLFAVLIAARLRRAVGWLRRR